MIVSGEDHTTKTMIKKNIIANASSFVAIKNKEMANNDSKITTKMLFFLLLI